MILKHNFPLQSFNTFGIQARAEHFAPFHTVDELLSLLAIAPTPFLILGGGSNILLTRDVKGTVLKNEIEGINILNENDNEVVVMVGGGVVWHDFVKWSIEKNLGGIENLSLIPGSVGAAPMQNIGAYGTELKSVFKELEAVHISTKAVRTFSNHDCQFHS